MRGGLITAEHNEGCIEGFAPDSRSSAALSRRRPRAISAILPAAAVLGFQVAFFPIPLGVSLQGAVLGLINAMVVLGLILVYRTNRVVNFAQASFGVFPAATAGAVVLFGAPGLVSTVLLAVFAGVVVFVRSLTIGRRAPPAALLVALPVIAFCAIGLHITSPLGWFGGLMVGTTVAVLGGIGAHAIVIRRLSTAPRLVLTVATIGLAQFFAIMGLLIPRMWGQVALVDPIGDRTGFDLPFQQAVTVGSTVFGSAEITAVLISLMSIGVVTAVLRRSHIGIAARAAADNGPRASMLGVPVPRVEAGVWIVASVLGFLATYAQAGILGLELTPGVGLRVMVAALGAMAIGGFRSIPAQLLAAVSIGVLIQATGPAAGHSVTLTDAVLAAVVVVGLLVRRVSSQRIDRDTTSSWQTVAEPRGLPFELARMPLLRALRIAVPLILVAIVAALPLVAGDSFLLRASTLVALVVVATSVVVLTGWTGAVTLGQMSFAATGAAVAAYATAQWRVDMTLALLVGGLAGAAAAVLVGLPSVRRQGMLLAITTLAFALGATNYLFNPTVATWIPTADIPRRPLFGVIDMGSRTAMYELSLAVAVVCIAGLLGIRRMRVGRAIRALRDNPEAAQAYGIGLMATRLVALALSGFVAGVGGVLLLSISERYEVALFGANESLNVFISSVVGGVGSLIGAVTGAVLVDGSRGFLSGPVSLLPSALGVLGVLLLLPGGLAEALYRVRDRFLRWFAGRCAIHVPSLVADTRIPEVPSTLARDGEPLGSPIGARQGHEPGPPEPVPEPGWLSVRSLDVRYGDVQVLFGVDFDIPRGSITALLGTNGAGKSTLLKAIGGVAKVTRGTLCFDGVDLASLRPEEIPACGIMQMPGGHGVFPSLTVGENLRVATWLFRYDRDADKRIADAIARFPVLESRLNEPAADLSGGQQQQLALAMALLGQPALLLVDELSVGLAPTVVETLLAELRRLRDTGTTIVIVEQSINVALTIADHAYFMEKGEIRFSGDASGLLEHPDLVRAVYLKGARDALTTETPSTSMARLTLDDHSSGRAREPDPTERSVALDILDLSVSFGGNHAVRDVSFTVQAGEIVGLIGPNGAGKTTLFDLISGFTPADAGRVLLSGSDISRTSSPGRARLGIGRSFQDARLFSGLTVTEAMSVSLERWIDGDGVISAAFRLPAAHNAERHIAERVDELVELFGLQSFRSKRIDELSTGSRRMVDLACVVAQSPSVVLLDEPTSGIAQREAEALGPMLVGLRDRLDATLLVIEHDISLISSIADRLVALDQGAVVASGTPPEVLDDPHVVASYLGTSDDVLRRSDHQALPSVRRDGEVPE